MTQYAVTVRGAAAPSGVIAPEIHSHAGVPVPGHPGYTGEHAGADEDAPKCGEIKANGEPCTNTAGDDGLCGIHRKTADDSTASK